MQAGDGKTWSIVNPGSSLAYYMVEFTGNVTNFRYLFGSQNAINGTNVDNPSKAFTLLGQSYVLYSIFYGKSGDVSYVSGSSPAWISYAGGGGNVGVTTQIAYGISPAPFSGYVNTQVHNEYAPLNIGAILLSCWS